MPENRSRTRRVVALIVLALGYVGLSQLQLPTYALPPNFQDTTVWSGLTLPTAVRFAPDGRVFVAEKAGVIKVFDSVSDPTPTVFADMSTEVFNFVDLGLLGLAVDPGYPSRPYVYALYAIDALPGGSSPYYGDTCNTNNCPHLSRLVRLTSNASGTAVIGQQTLREGWCQTIPDHSTGDLVFDANGYLVVSHGDGANPTYLDYGQTVSCAGDPPLEGGGLHSQDIRTSGDPLTYAGSIIRINPDTGEAAPTNPLVGGALAEDDPIIATGLRNPFRFSIDSLTGRLWIGDVGWNTWEEVDRVDAPITSVPNFGWPCYEGVGRQPQFDGANLPLCEALYLTNPSAVTAPYYQYVHEGSGVISAIALYRGSNFPSTYDGALFFADYSHNWIKVMMPGADGLPNTANIVDFAPSNSNSPAVDLQIGPGGELYYVNIFYGAIHKIAYVSNNTPPVAEMTADVTSGPIPLTVQFDGSTSHDTDLGDTISYSWDLNGDGTYGDATGPTAQYTYNSLSAVNARLRVTDSHGAIDTAILLIAAGSSAPVATIVTPNASTSLYRVGDAVAFSGSAVNPDNGLPLPASQLSWRILLNHCAVTNPLDCHEHYLQQLSGVAGGTMTAPDHEYPSFLRFELTATKPPSGPMPALSSVVSQTLMPQTTTVTLNTVPSGLQVSIYAATTTSPLTRTVIVNGQTTVIAPTPQAMGGQAYQFVNWSDGGAQTHLITATAVPMTLTANYEVTDIPLQSTWNSWDVVTQSGTPQATVTSALTGATATIEFYESVNDGGVLKNALLGSFTTPPHTETFNKVERYWGPAVGATYPYGGKSTVNRGSDTGETNTPMPLGVRDLQLHPPNNAHLTVSAFRVPGNGNYTITNLAARRVHNQGGPATLRVFNAQQVEIASLQAQTSRAWTVSPSSYNLNNLVAGSYIYFAVDRAGDWGWDATEIAWTITTSIAGPPPPPPPPTPSCTLTASPSVIDQGMTTTLTWVTANATSISINNGVGSVVPVAGGTVAPTPPTTTTYQASVQGAGGNGSCSATVTVNPIGGGGSSIWNSWDVVTQSGAPQGLVTASGSGVAANVEFYESTNDAGINKGALFSTFTTAAHPEAFNNLERYWGNAAGTTYPYAGKSTVNRGSGTGETNAQMPLGVRDLQLHPPNNLHYTVAAFRVPSNGDYTLTNLGVRRVHNLGSNVTYHVYNAQQTEIATLTATANRAWVVSPTAYSLTNLVAGSYIYFAVDRAGDYFYDATEVSWTIAASVGPPPPPPPPMPTCTINASPATITQGMMTTLTWTTANAASISINNGVGDVLPVAGGSVTPSPAATTTYQASVVGAGGNGSCSTTVTVNPVGGGTSTWNSWDVLTQAGLPQGSVTSTGTVVSANIEFYESTNNAGVVKGALFPTFTTAAHPEGFNNLERYWGNATGVTYPYAGKSTVNRGTGVGETNSPMPLGVRDLQIHPPNNLHYTVAAFRVPSDGNYTVSNLGVRRVHNQGGSVILHVFNPQQVEIATLTATANRAWVSSPTTYNLSSLVTGSYIYFAIDRAGDYSWDASEIAWTITRTGP